MAVSAKNKQARSRLLQRAAAKETPTTKNKCKQDETCNAACCQFYNVVKTLGHTSIKPPKNDRGKED